MPKELSKDRISSSEEDSSYSDSAERASDAIKRRAPRLHRERKRPAVARFLDVEAAVGSDDDDEEMGEEDRAFIDEDEEAAEGEGEPRAGEDELREVKAEMEAIAARRLMRQQQLRGDEFSPEMEAQRIKDMYGRRRATTAIVGADRERISSALILPGISDAKLWLLRCKPGKEQTAALSLLRFVLEQRHKLGAKVLSSTAGDDGGPADLSIRPILSVLARDQLKGYIYVEAHRPTDVARIVKEAHLDHLLFAGGVSGASLTVVPVNEVNDVLTAPARYPGKTASMLLDNSASLPDVGAWVRVKRGKYANDLGQVVEVNTDEGLLRLKMVPRMPVPEPGGAKPSKGARPPQRLFELKQAALIAPVTKARGFWVFSGEHYKDGFLFKHFKPSALILQSISPPRAHELDAFGVGPGEASPSNPAQPAPEAFSTGDRVQILRGELVSLTGTVRDAPAGRGLCRVELDDRTVLEELVTVSATDLQRHFEIGEQVQVAPSAPIDAGMAGVLIAISGDSATLFSPINARQWQAPRSHLQSIEHGNARAGAEDSDSLLVDDLVRLVDVEHASAGGGGGDTHAVGLVLRVIEAERAVQVMDQFGQIRGMPRRQIQLIGHVTKPRPQTPLDAEELSTGDLVEAFDSPQQAMHVIHVFRDFVFCRDQYSGQPSAHSLVMLRRKHASHSAAGGAEERPRGAGGKGQRSLLGKTVSISGGPFKGYIGIVKEITDSMARVELHTNSKIITVERDRISLPSDAAAGDWKRAAGATPTWNAGGKTPAWNAGGKTPAWNAGGKTPAWNTGSKTPAWNAGGKTPTWNTGGKTPSWNAPTGKTPAWGTAKTPSWAVPGQPTTVANAASGSSHTGAPAWAQQGVEVTGADEAWTGTVTASVGDTLTVTDRQGSSRTVSIGQVVPAIPSKKDRVLICSSESRAQRLVGSLVGLDGSDAVVKMDNSGDFRIVSISDLAKLSPS